MHNSAQTKIEICEKQPAELGEIEGEYRDDDPTEQDDFIFKSTSLDIDATL
jgi:hypothetical protein